MKKMIAGLLFSLSFALCVPARSQNLLGRVDTYNQGAPNYTANSGGSSYGQWASSASGSGWSLGYGTSQSVTGTAVLTWDATGLAYFGLATSTSTAFKANGWVEKKQATAPTVSSCGTGPSVAAGTDQAGDVTIGSLAATSCTITFAAAPTNIPHCACNNRTSKLPCYVQPTSTTAVLVGSGSGNMDNIGDVLDWVCSGHY